MIAYDSDLKEPTNENNPEKSNDDTTNDSTEYSSDRKTESDKNSEKKEEEDDDDNIERIRRYGKSNRIKLSLILLFLILLV